MQTCMVAAITAGCRSRTWARQDFARLQRVVRRSFFDAGAPHFGCRHVQGRAMAHGGRHDHPLISPVAGTCCPRARVAGPEA
eukprot:5573887-Pyramimonas_sp.AAC.1